MKHTILSVSVALATAFTFTTATAQKVATDHYTSGKTDCVIFPGTYPSDVDGKPFTPSHDDVDQAVKLIGTNLKKIKCDRKDDRDEVFKNLAKYKMQFFAYTDKLGNKILLVNCFRGDYKDKDLSTMWLTDMIQVQDGGTYFWTIKYDTGKNELFEFKINGNG